MPGISLNYHSSLSVDDSTSYSQRIHPSQQYYYQSVEQSTFYPYQSQLSLQNDPQQKSSTSSTDTRKCDWNELEVTGNVRNLSPILWTLSQLTVLYLNDNQLTRLPSEIACLTNLVTLDLSNNKLRNLPSEIGELISLRELNLTNNSIRNLPYELGKLFRLQSLGLIGNPLPSEIYTLYTESNGLQKLLTYFLDSLPSSLNATQPPPARSWIRLASPNATQPTAIFTIMNYNILCDKYATRHVYGYCPSWALKWDYRRKQILEELRSYAADIIALQEIETDQFHAFFLPELQKNGYDGVFSPKSRAKTMCEQDRRYVDGCAIFYRQSKFRLIKHYLVEFNQLAMSAANGTACHDMMNRVMTKDNIGLVAFLETKEETYSHTFSNGVLPTDHKQMLFVCTAHIHWDPEYCDVKVVQTLMLLSELKTIMEDAIQKHRPNSNQLVDCSTIPLVLCGDFNSLPGSGVIELMRNGKISMNHADFKELSYETYLQKYSRVDGNPTSSNDIVHQFKLNSAYETTAEPIMPYTNFTYDFKGIIDYVFFSSQLMRVLGVLGPLDPEWLQTNKIVGCPHPNVPSDHFSLLVEFELNPSTNDNSKTSTTTSTIPTRRQ
ncbi:hypothetical protein I4U23_024855 [Adineta vaga]|nr:hypothetical protein I4U23_024855 [Adineta vaga]